MNRPVVLLALVAILAWAGVAQAQCCGQPAAADVYAPAPTVAYDAHPPAVYYARYAPRTVYYAPPRVAYYAPAPVPAPVVVTTRYRPFLRGTVTRARYPLARPWVAGYYPYW